jgi:hypothetical protein
MADDKRQDPEKEELLEKIDELADDTPKGRVAKKLIEELPDSPPAKPTDPSRTSR